MLKVGILGRPPLTRLQNAMQKAMDDDEIDVCKAAAIPVRIPGMSLRKVAVGTTFSSFLITEGELFVSGCFVGDDGVVGLARGIQLSVEPVAISKNKMTVCGGTSTQTGVPQHLMFGRGCLHYQRHPTVHSSWTQRQRHVGNMPLTRQTLGGE